jgi:hypothetical protein
MALTLPDDGALGWGDDERNSIRDASNRANTAQATANSASDIATEARTYASAAAEAAVAAAQTARVISNIATTDDAVSALVADPQTGPKTTAALNAAIGAGVEPVVERSPLVVNDRFAAFPDGQPAETLTGLPYTLYAPDNAAWRPTVSSGKLVSDVALTHGAYAQLGPTTDGIRHVAARWRFTPETISGGVFTVALMQADFVAYHSTNNAVPASGPHIIVSKTAISVTVFPTAGGAPVQVMNASPFANGLLMDSTTEYGIDVHIDPSTGICYIVGPDGEVYTCQHDEFKQPARWAFIEQYRDPTVGDVTGMTMAQITEFRVSDQTAPHFAAVLAQVNSQPLFDKKVTAASSVGFALSTTASLSTMETYTTFKFRTPLRRRVIIDVEFWIDITAVDTGGASEVRFGLFNETNSLVSYEIVATRVEHSGKCRASFEHSLSTAPGALNTRKIAFYVVNASTAATVILAPQKSGRITVSAIKANEA